MVPVTQPHDADEFDKRIVSAIVEATGSIILVDNVSRQFHSDLLLAGMTGEYISGRVLGTNRRASVATDAVTACMTGNNPVLYDDMKNRVIHIRLDSNREHPEERTGFRHRLPGDAKAERALLLSCVASAAQRWLESGCPGASGRVLGGFEEYMTAAGGIMDLLDFPGYNGNRAALADEVDDTFKTFVTEWLKQDGGKPSAMVDLIDLSKLLGAGKGGQPTLSQASATIGRGKDRIVSVSGDKWKLAKNDTLRELQKLEN